MTPPPAADLAGMDGATLFRLFRDTCLARMGDLVSFNARSPDLGFAPSGPARQEADAFEAMAMAFDKAVKSGGRATLKDMADAAREAAKVAAARRLCEHAGGERRDGDGEADPEPGG